MSDPTLPPDGAHALVLESIIDAAELARIDCALKAALLERALAQRARWFARADRLRPPGMTDAQAANICKWLSLAGLVGALALAALGGVGFHGQRADVVLGLFFGMLIGLSFVLAPFTAWIRRPWAAYWNLLAKVTVGRLLKKARASVSFGARYEFQAGHGSYFRTVGGRAELAWKRRLHGVRVSGPGFTLLYKKPASRNPYAILLHQPSARFDALLDALAVPTLARQGP